LESNTFRLGINKTWVSRWYAENDFGKLLQEDLTIRKYLKKKLYQAGVSKVEIERALCFPLYRNL